MAKLAFLRVGKHWTTNASAVVTGTVKVPRNCPDQGYFYQGPTLHFGHMPPRKGRKKKGA